MKIMLIVDNTTGSPSSRLEKAKNLWFSSRDLTFGRNQYWVTSGHLQFETLYGE